MEGAAAVRTKNAKAITQDEHDHIERVKLLPCGVCGVGGGYGAPSQAHHQVQGQHFTVIPLCDDCHNGSHNGIHKLARIWSVYKATELSVLNDTIRRLYG
jgi:hypothetical protein